MLSPRQNLIETIKGGDPDRYVNQFEPFEIVWTMPQEMRHPSPEYGKTAVNAWGVTTAWYENTPGEMPVHDEEHLVVKDIAEWERYVEAPSLDFNEDEWRQAEKDAAAVDRNTHILTVMDATGFSDVCHYLLSMEEYMTSFYTEPEALHGLIDYISDYAVDYATMVCEHLHPDAVYRHDDWGSQLSTFTSPEMFEDFFLEPTKRLYDCYRNHGVELIIHHSDSYAETLVPYMVEMGVDIWQGGLDTNDFPKIIKEFGPEITLMGGINSGKLDIPDWTPGLIETEVHRVCDWAGTRYFIPNLTQGAPMSTFPGVYECVSKVIDRISAEKFPLHDVADRSLG